MAQSQIPQPTQWAPPPPPVDPRLPGGLVVASMGKRIGAYILDCIILAIVGFAILAVLGSVGLWITRVPDAARPLDIEYNYPALLIDMVLGLIVSGSYYIYLWTARRATCSARNQSRRPRNPTRRACPPSRLPSFRYRRIRD